jgi:hypothetical protein
MPPHLYERVDKWTHEPRSIFNNKKHLLLDFSFYALIKSENTKNIFTSCNYNKNPQTSLLFALIYIIALVYFLAFYLFIVISFY